MKDLGNKSYEVVFVTGTDSYDDVIKNKFPDNVKIFPYIENMARLMKKTDVIVSRAGASTLSEIIALKSFSSSNIVLSLFTKSCAFLY